MTPTVITRAAATLLAAMAAVALADAGQPSTSASAGLPLFVDVTRAAGIQFKHTSGAFGRKFLPETMGSGAAFLDADGDGRQDVLLVNSMPWPGQPPTRAVMALYRNKGNGTFTDVTAKAGLAVPIYGMGVAAADYDNDGRVDIYITALGQNRLFRNMGGLKFRMSPLRQESATRAFRRAPPGSTSTATAGSISTSPTTSSGRSRRTCSARSTGRRSRTARRNRTKASSPTLYRNRGDGTFENATQRAGLADPTAKALGVALVDHNADGWVDLFVANDTQPNRLYREQAQRDIR